MSDDIIRLRLCGSTGSSRDAKSFIHAFDYYCLWSITSNAMNLLRHTAAQEKKEGSRSIMKQGEVHDHYKYRLAHDRYVKYHHSSNESGTEYSGSECC